MFVRSLRLRCSGAYFEWSNASSHCGNASEQGHDDFAYKGGCIDAQRVTDVMSYLRCSEAALLLFTFVELTAGNLFCFSSSLCTLLNMFLDQKVEEYLQLQQ